MTMKNRVHVGDAVVARDTVVRVTACPCRDAALEVGAAAGPAGAMTGGEGGSLIKKPQQRVAARFGQRALRVVGVAGGTAGQPGRRGIGAGDPAVIVVQDPAIADPVIGRRMVAEEVPARGEADLGFAKPLVFDTYFCLVCIVTI